MWLDSVVNFLGFNGHGKHGNVALLLHSSGEYEMEQEDAVEPKFVLDECLNVIHLCYIDFDCHVTYVDTGCERAAELRGEGRIEEAEESAKEFLVARRLLSGKQEDHKELADSFCLLGSILKKQQLTRRSDQSSPRVFSDEVTIIHWFYRQTPCLIDFFDLAVLLEDEGAYEEAYELLEEDCFVMRRHSNGLSHFWESCCLLDLSTAVQEK